MIYDVNDKNIKDAAFVYMCSWKESHKNICSEDFIEKHDIEYMTKFLSEKIENKYKIYISYINNIPVGIIGINPFDEEICLLYVSPEYQNRGYGNELLKYALSLCKNPYITVLDTNKKAIDFYTKRGFVSADIQPPNTEEKRIFERKYIYQYKNM